MAEKITALEPVRTSSPMTAYEPRSFDEALRLATAFASSSLLGEVRNPEAALLIMATGAELGIPATTALRAIHIVKGRPVISSDLLVAMCIKRRDLCEYFICTESTEEHATYETKRIGVSTPVRNTFTLADAQRAGLGGPQSNWAKYPRAMLRHRASAELARQVYPDIVLGLYVDAEEDDLRGNTIDVTPQIVTESVRSAEPEQELLSAAMDRWRTALFTAATKEECEAVRKESKARVAKGMPEYAVLADLYATRIRELREQKPVEAQIVDRTPGSDDA
jgi:hypothetical protein